MGVDRSNAAYWRRSCDLRISGGLYDGGCVRGNRAMGRIDVFICSMDGAGVVTVAIAVAVAMDAVRHLGSSARGRRARGRLLSRWHCAQMVLLPRMVGDAL